MRWSQVSFALGLCALGIGCETPIGSGFEIARYSSRNLLQAPVTAGGDRLERHWQRQQAEAAWKDFQHHHAEQLYSVHYERGFQDGFADYLYAGGTGQPPPVPPWTLRTASYETPAGHRAVEDWFAGFRHGANAARESGLRELVIVPGSVPPTMRGSAAHAHRQSVPKRSEPEVLPPPRELPAEDQPAPAPQP